MKKAVGRMNPEDVRKREQWLYDYFKANPESNVPAANTALASAPDMGKTAMRINRVYELKKAALAGHPIPPAVPRKARGKSGRKAGRSRKTGLEARVKLPASPSAVSAPRAGRAPNGLSEEQVLKGVHEMLIRHGMTNVQISYTPPTRTITF